jgi:hypothetical protein
MSLYVEALLRRHYVDECQAGTVDGVDSNAPFVTLMH